MATFFINSSNETTNGTPDDDQFFIESGVNRVDLQGNAGNDEFRYFFGAANSSFNFGNSNANGNAGNDTIRILLNTGTDILANNFRGGLDNDSIVLTATTAGSGSVFAGNLLQAGQGNDTVKLKLGSADYNNVSINGNEGVDFITVSASASVGKRVSNIVIGGGKDNDQIQLDINGTGTQGFNIAGGAGSDRLQLQFETGTTNFVVNGGSVGTVDSVDGGDDIFVSANRLLGATILGNNGNDTIKVVGDTAENTLIDGNGGNDTVIISANELKNVTLAGGAGNDLVIINNSAGTFSAGRVSLLGGNGNDTLFVGTAGNMSGAPLTIAGGGGADLFAIVSSTDRLEASGVSAVHHFTAGNFSYASLTDSTIDALDTIVVGSGNATSTTLTMFMPASVPVTVFNGQAGGYQFSAGILEMDTAAGSGGNISLSQIVGALDGTLSEGEAVAFRLGTSDSTGYVFVAGDKVGVDDDLLVSIVGFTGEAMSAGAATMVNGGTNSVILDIAG